MGYDDKFKSGKEEEPEFIVDDTLLAAQLQQMQELKQLQHNYQSMIQQHNEQQAFINSAEAREAQEAFKKKSSDEIDYCGDFQNGRCTRGKSCMYRHEIKDTRYCGDFFRGACRWAEKCKFPHHKIENGTPLYTNFSTKWSGTKWKMCTFFLEGKCQRGQDCTYAHYENEMNEIHWIGNNDDTDWPNEGSCHPS